MKESIEVLLFICSLVELGEIVPKLIFALNAVAVTLLKGLAHWPINLK